MDAPDKVYVIVGTWYDGPGCTPLFATRDEALAKQVLQAIQLAGSVMALAMHEGILAS